MNELKNCETPSDSDTICRFFTTSKFESLLKYKKLYFARSDMFKDELEGLPPNYKEYFYRYEYQRDYFYLSCWTLNNKLSLKLWKEYASEDKGIAIKTTVKKIKNQLKPHQGDILLFCKVLYDQEKQRPENFST